MECQMKPKVVLLDEGYILDAHLIELVKNGGFVEATYKIKKLVKLDYHQDTVIGDALNKKIEILYGRQKSSNIQLRKRKESCDNDGERGKIIDTIKLIRSFDFCFVLRNSLKNN